MVKDLNNEGLIESFWITNGSIKIRESSQSKPISITMNLIFIPEELKS